MQVPVTDHLLKGVPGSVMDNWINAESLKQLRTEVEEHKKNLPLYRSELAAYREKEDELLARVKLHMDVMKPKRRKI